MKLCKCLLAIVAVVPRAALALEVSFFLSDIINTCAVLNSTAIMSPYITELGGVCAFMNSNQRTYYCPAPERRCRTGLDSCPVVSGTTQVACKRASFEWCCDILAGETCNEDSYGNAPDACLSGFTSPNALVDVEEANKSYLESLGISSATAMAWTTYPNWFTTHEFSPVSATTSSVQTSTGSLDFSSGFYVSSEHVTTPTSNLGVTSADSTATAVSSTTGDPNISTGLTNTTSASTISAIVFGIFNLIGISGTIYYFIARRKAKISAQKSIETSTISPLTRPDIFVTASTNIEESDAWELNGVQTPRHELSNVSRQQGRSFIHSNIGRTQRHELG